MKTKMLQLKIDTKIYKDFKEYCKLNGLKMKFAGEQAINNYIKKDESLRPN